MWLYKITHKESGKAYVGTSVNPISHRISRHLYAAKCGRKDMAIACAIRKYTLYAFNVECIGQSDDYEELLWMEAEAIKSHNTLAPNGYNLTEGGRGARRKCLPETKALISVKTMGRVPWNKGKKTGPISDELRRKISEVQKGRKAWNKGVPFTPEALKNLRESAKLRRGGNNHHAKPIEFGGVNYPSIVDAVRATGLTMMQVRYRLQKGIGRYLPS